MVLEVNKVQQSGTTSSVAKVTVPKSEVIFDYQTQPPTDNVITKTLWSSDTNIILYNTVQEIGISSYTPFVLRDDNTAIRRAQSHLIDLMKYYEGDRKYYYEAHTTPYKDKYGTTTCGFGELTNKPMTQERAYELLCKRLKSYSGEVKNLLNKKIGKNTYENLPNSIKEGLIDLCYNKGLGTISGNKELMEAIKDKDYSKIVANLSYIYSNKSGVEKVEDAGLYRRSLNRAILATRDLDGKELKQAKEEIEKLYEKALVCHEANKASKTELNKIYEQFTQGKISTPAVSAESFKITVGEEFKGKGVWAVAQALYKSCGDSAISFQEFYKDFLAINGNPAQISIGQELKVPFINNVTKSDEPVDGITIVDCPESTETESVEENKKPGFFARIWSGIKSFFKGIGNFFKKLFGIDKDKYETITVCSEEQSPFQKLMQEGKIEKDGEFQIITLDYKVNKGDNLWKISREYGTSQAILCNVNNIEDKDKIREGEIIKIQKLGYKVEKGDNLFRIAKKFGLTVEILKDLNNITDVDKINEGQMLEIPGFTYTVKPKDTLSKISRLVGVSVKDLKQINGLSSDMISPNQIIKVVYNDSDFAVSSDNKKVTYDSATNTKTEVVNMKNTAKLSTRPLLQKKTKVNGKVVATRAVFNPTASGALSGKTIIVNAGHGYSQANTDIGTPGLKGLDDEWLLNYDNAMKLKDKLCAKGAKVIFLQGKRRLIEEEVKKSKNNADLFISVHVNSSAKPTQDRTQIYYRDKGVSGEPKQNSIKLANIMEKNFDEWIPKHESISSADKFIFQEKQDYAQSSVNDNRTGLLKTPLNDRRIPSVIWEVAFMSSPKGRERLKDANLMSDYADIMAKSVVEYFES